MPRIHLISLLWPGLPRLWYGAEKGGLAEAIGFAVLFNMMLAATFSPYSWLENPWLGVGWTALAMFWGVSVWKNNRWLCVQAKVLSGAAQAEDLLPQAQVEYLKGHWFEAEQLLEQIIEVHPLDAEAHLMLASLFRHTRNEAAAKKQLNRLARLETAGKWQVEIEREWQQLELLAENEEEELVESAAPKRQAA